jgi:hypothetical protein
MQRSARRPRGEETPLVSHGNDDLKWLGFYVLRPSGNFDPKNSKSIKIMWSNNTISVKLWGKTHIFSAKCQGNNMMATI